MNVGRLTESAMCIGVIAGLGAIGYRSAGYHWQRPTGDQIFLQWSLVTLVALGVFAFIRSEYMREELESSKSEIKDLSLDSFDLRTQVLEKEQDLTDELELARTSVAQAQQREKQLTGEFTRGRTAWAASAQQREKLLRDELARARESHNSVVSQANAHCHKEYSRLQTEFGLEKAKMNAKLEATESDFIEQKQALVQRAEAAESRFNGLEARHQSAVALAEKKAFDALKDMQALAEERDQNYLRSMQELEEEKVRLQENFRAIQRGLEVATRKQNS